ncbi:MAG: NAD(P)-dependent oxidoreductase [Deltaproteobacteria bacterium]|nr:NAD(P)-dependent oxidoreductase [Deltaproteobacteria bacterium]
MTERVAWLGTGLLGSGFVAGLRTRGIPVDAWNRTASKLVPLAELGAVPHPRASAAVANAARVHLCLADDAAVDAVLDEIIPHLPAGAIMVDHSTVTPEGTVRRCERMQAAGVAFVHAPVFMSPDNARTATGIMLCSAPRALFERVEAALRPMTGKLMYLGERPDKGAAFKLFGNAMIMALAAGVADVLVLARATGIEPAEAMALFKDFPVGRQIDIRGARMAQGDFNATFELSMARKDVRLMLQTARASPLPLAVLPAIAERMDALIASGHGREDLGVLALEVFGQVAARGRMRPP